MGELSSEQGACRMSRSPVFSVALYEPDSMIVDAEETDEAGFVTNNAVICMKTGPPARTREWISSTAPAN